MASQNQPKLTKNESPLRQKEDERKKRQWYDDTLTKLETYHTRLMRFLLPKGNKFPDTDALSKVSPGPSPEQEALAKRALADFETLLLYSIPSITSTKTQRVRLPITGDIDMRVTQGQTHTTFPQEEEKQEAFQELLAQCQEQIRTRYHLQFSRKYPEATTFFEDLECMPHTLKTGALNYFSLKSHYPNGCFPGTEVLIQLDLSLGDRIICE